MPDEPTQEQVREAVEDLQAFLDYPVMFLDASGVAHPLAPDENAIRTLLAAYTRMEADLAEARRLMEPFAEVSAAYYRNELDEARPFNGDNSRDPWTIELLNGRGGKRLITLGDCHEVAAFHNKGNADDK